MNRLSNLRTSKPILITGAHRSGTTWVGKMISSSPGIHYIHEPFNIDYGGFDLDIHNWFQYICRENESGIYDRMKKMIFSVPRAENQKRIPWKKGLRRLNKGRILVKDPIAVFSAEWLASRFNMDVVVMIRHPAAFAASLKELKWTHNFSHFLNQPLLMKNHLNPFEEEILQFTKKEHDIIDQAALL